jgi:dihydroorotase
MRRRWPDEDPDTAIRRLARHLGERPADLFGLAGKGKLVAGADADLVIFDPDHAWMLSAADVEAKCGWSAYEGWTFTGQVQVTVKSGRIAYDRESGAFGEPVGRWLSDGRRADD